MRKYQKRLLYSLVFLVAVYLLLLMPGRADQKIVAASHQPFRWSVDSFWNKLEADFVEGKQTDSLTASKKIDSLFQASQSICSFIESNTIPAKNNLYDSLLNDFFVLAPLVASRPDYIDRFNDLYSRIKTAVKHKSQSWDMNKLSSRNRLYKNLYGMRAAVEEVALQQQTDSIVRLIKGKDEPSATPSTEILGIKVHGGDMLVSRGGAEVSAFISRGNDYPGNFSHVALIYVDEQTKIPYLIEAHIEKGVAIASVDQYIKDKKLRCMVLRPRADLPQLKADPMLPQKAAKFAYIHAMQKHIPYDFKMNFYDSSAMFCSEVASYAYKKNGLQLWKAISTISSPGIENWLHAFGVEHFVTQMPSDLEYDPQLTVVAEWKDNETLLNDHVYNAVMDGLITEADKGTAITFPRWQLPFARLLKAYCFMMNRFGKVAMIPEGMSAEQALKNQSFVSMFQTVKKAVENDVHLFIQQKHYNPPYWQIVKMAEKNAKSFVKKNEK